MNTCPHCGTQMPATAKFCTSCGAPLTPPQTSTPPPRPGGKQSSPLKPLAIVLAVLVVVLGIVLAALLLTRGGGARSYDDCMALAARYLEELDFEQAEAMYLEALQLDPSQVEAYRALAEMYIEQERFEDALDILERGIDATGSGELQEMYDELAASLEPEPEAALTSYLEETLIPALGQCKTGPYTSYLDERQSTPTASGIISHLLIDLDDDGQSELLVAMMDSQHEKQERWEDDPNYAVLLQVYEYTSSEVFLADEYCALTNLLSTGVSETDWVFLKILENARYLCGSKVNMTAYLGDGGCCQAFVVSYDGSQFQEHAQYHDCTSIPWDYTSGFEPFTSALEEIGGFETSLSNMSNAPVFLTSEPCDAVLFSIYGENKYYNLFGTSSSYANDLYDYLVGQDDPHLWGPATFYIFPNTLPVSATDTAGDSLSAYADIVQNYELIYGELEFHTPGDMIEHYSGVFLVDLVDFDNNGTDELVIGKIPPDESYAVQSEYGFSPSLDVWSLEDGVPFLAYDSASTLDDGTPNASYIQWNGTYYLITGYRNDNAGYAEYLALENGAFSPSFVLSWDGNHYYVNGTEPTLDEFTALEIELSSNEMRYSGLTNYSTYSQAEIASHLYAARSRLGLE